MNYQDTLDLIFKSFIAAKPYIQGKFDREVRKPELLLNVARKLDILPSPEKIIKVTGSKGKGTVARLCASRLADYGRVALVVSPEEIDHTDRMQINGVCITQDRFAACFAKVWAAVEEPTAPDYLSPYGLFLLTAFMWFNEEGVDYYVIETGRGVRFDEGGQLHAKTGVVTSVFLEHASYLGPTFEEIYEDKLSIVETCEDLIVGEMQDETDGLMPAWYATCQAIAQQVLETFLDQKIALPDGTCASFGHRTDDAGRLWVYEGMISKDSADEAYLRKLIKTHEGQVQFYVSLPDDKDFTGVCELLDGLDASVNHIILTGERGVLSYEQATRCDVAYKGGFDDVGALQQNLSIPKNHAIYFIGTQTFLRLVKQAYFS